MPIGGGGGTGSAQAAKLDTASWVINASGARSPQDTTVLSSTHDPIVGAATTTTEFTATGVIAPDGRSSMSQRRSPSMVAPGGLCVVGATATIGSGNGQMGDISKATWECTAPTLIRDGAGGDGGGGASGSGQCAAIGPGTANGKSSDLQA